MVNNLMRSSDIHVIGVGFWFIDVLAQCFLFLAVLLSFRACAASPRRIRSRC